MAIEIVANVGAQVDFIRPTARYLEGGIHVLTVPPIDLGVARVTRRRHKAVQTVELETVIDIHVVILVIAPAAKYHTS
jgi:hypothetical protein